MKNVLSKVDSKIGQLKNYMWHLNDESYLERMDKSFRYCKLESENLIKNNIQVKSSSDFQNNI